MGRRFWEFLFPKTSIYGGSAFGVKHIIGAGKQIVEAI